MRTEAKFPVTGVRLPLAGLLLAVVCLLPAVWESLHADDVLKQAEEDFQSYCAPCHGTDARGDGPASQILTTRPADLTQLAKRNGGAFPVDKVYGRIEGLDMPAAHGDSEMPVWGMWFTNQAIGESILLDDAKPAAERVRQRIGALVAYLQTIQE